MADSCLIVAYHFVQQPMERLCIITWDYSYMSWFELVVLATLPELCYITTMLMSQGDTVLRTTMHGVVLNILHSLTMLPELSHSGELPLHCIL